MRLAVFWILATALAGTAVADFAGVEGFSGRVADCSSCHVASDAAPPAQVTIEGLPSQWETNTTYPLTVTVTGGPPALPAPQPQGGFELEVSAGSLSIPSNMVGLLRSVSPTAMTYTPEGTQMRTWNVAWTTPSLNQQPAAVGVWVAGVSANGNHVVATNVSDAGEHGDQSATWHGTIYPHAETLLAWKILPLQAPSVSGAGTELTGRHMDDNATHLAWRINDADWQRRATGTQWRLNLDAAIDGILEVRSEGKDRVSPAVRIAFDAADTPHVLAQGEAAPDRNSPTPLLAFPAIAAALTLTRRFA